MKRANKNDYDISINGSRTVYNQTSDWEYLVTEEWTVMPDDLARGPYGSVKIDHLHPYGVLVEEDKTVDPLNAVRSLLLLCNRTQAPWQMLPWVQEYVAGETTRDFTLVTFPEASQAKEFAGDWTNTECVRVSSYDSSWVHQRIMLDGRLYEFANPRAGDDDYGRIYFGKNGQLKEARYNPITDMGRFNAFPVRWFATLGAGWNLKDWEEMMRACNADRQMLVAHLTDCETGLGGTAFMFKTDASLLQFRLTYSELLGSGGEQ